MRRILLVGVLSLGLAIPGIAGVRGTEWGMSKLQVRGVEGKPEDEEKDRLVYEDRLGGLKTAVVYLFNDREELYSIRYDFHMDKKERIFFNPALKQFDSISKILRDRYGPPTRGDIHSDREKRIANLVQKKPITEGWQRDEVTYVDHTLEYEKSYSHVLIYGHRGLTDEYEKSRKQEEMEKL